MKSMRRFLLLALLATILLLAVLESIWSHRQGVHEIDEVFDAQLAQYAHTLLGLIDHGESRQGMADLDRRLAATEIAGAHHRYEAQLGFQMWRGPDELLVSSSSLPASQLVPLQPGYQHADIAGQRWLFFTLHDAEHGRWLVAGQNSAIRSELAGRFALHDVTTAIALILALGTAVVLIMRLGLAPLDKLARQVGKRDENDLRAVATGDLPRELQPLAESINRAFARIDRALDREKQFTNDAAHELRTPVAIVQTQLENALADSTGATRPAIAAALDATRNLGQLIRQLLELARLSPESQRASYESVELHQLVREQIAANLALVDRKQLEVSLGGTAPVVVRGNPRLLAILVRNLLDNAINYTPVGGSIEASIDLLPGGAQLCISDSGPGIPAPQRQLALQRFYRLPAQQGDAGVSGCGLGLTLVDMIAQLHGARLELGDATPAGLRVCVQFPRA
jgi:two-component system sensor histidine kinase QseC